jgi:hypothetical protein
MKTVYVNDTNQASIICPKCGFLKNIDITTFKNTQKKAKAKCRCGKFFRFTFEFRKNYRKNVRLPGEYIVKGTGDKGDVIIRDLSLTGMRFESLNQHQISTNDILEVNFKLDNSVRSEIRKLAKVIWVRERIVAAHYSEAKLYEKDLGFYLRS